MLEKNMSMRVIHLTRSSFVRVVMTNDVKWIELNYLTTQWKLEVYLVVCLSRIKSQMLEKEV